MILKVKSPWVSVITVKKDNRWPLIRDFSVMGYT